MVVKVSVIISVFNGELWIDKAIENIRSQDYKNYELIIVNDGSNDKTEDRILHYANFFPEIKYFFKEHTGLTDSLNFALTKANGKWIARMDVDDISSFNRLSTQIKFAEERKNIVLVGSNFSINNKNSIVYKSHLPNNNKKLLYRLINMKGFFPHSSAFFLREKALEVGGYRKAFIKSQDHDLWLRLSEKGDIACNVERLIVINEHENRISNSNIGWSQYAFAFLGVISYYSRKNNINYFENRIDNNDIEDQLMLINNFLESNNFFKIERLKNKISYVLNQKNKFKIFPELINIFFRKGFLIILIIKRFLFGTQLPIKFYFKFLKSSSSKI